MTITFKKGLTGYHWTVVDGLVIRIFGLTRIKNTICISIDYEKPEVHYIKDIEELLGGTIEIPPCFETRA